MHLAITFTPNELERFWRRVNKTETGCWTWAGALNRGGYGTFGFRTTSTTAHRASYLIAHGTIGNGLVIDHLCRNRACVNPSHLEAVTPEVNSRRSPLVYKTHCANGHEFTPDNTAMYAAGVAGSGYQVRYCLTCTRDRARESMRRQRRKNGAVPWAERTQCGKGHELTPDNVYVRPSRPNARECRTCKGMNKAAAA